MHFFTTASLTFTLLATTNAAPTHLARSNIKCPGQSYLGPTTNCPSGFVGCAPYEKASEVCNGAKRFYNDCSGAVDLGSFHHCKSGGVVTFIGCTTNANICQTTATTLEPVDSVEVVENPGGNKPVDNKPVDNKPEQTPHTSSKPWSCPPKTWYAQAGECSSGFVGCTTDAATPDVCPGEKRFWGSCPAGHGNYYNCSNGFVGCTTNTRICG